MLEDAKGDPQELVHERPKDTHVGLAGTFESCGFGLKTGVAAEGAYRGHKKSLAEVSVAGLAEFGSGFEGATGGDMARTQAGISNGLGSRFEGLDRRQFGKDDRSGVVANPIDRAKELSLSSQGWIGLDDFGDRFLQCLNAAFQGTDGFFYVAEDRFALARVLQAIAFLGQFVFPVEDTSSQLLQFVSEVGWRSPRGGLNFFEV